MIEHEETLRREINEATFGMNDHARAVFLLGVALALGYATRKMSDRLTEIKNAAPDLIGCEPTVRR